MKILRATSKGEMDKWYDEAALKRLDEEQGRRRLNGAESEALIGFATASNLCTKTLPVLEKVAEETGITKRMKQIATMLHNTVPILARKVDSSQLISMANNINDVSIVLSANPTPGYCNISWADLQTICNHAMSTCEMGCALSRDESKRCPVRKALSHVPGIRDVRKSRGNTKECPFAGIALEWNEEAME